MPRPKKEPAVNKLINETKALAADVLAEVRRQLMKKG